MFILYMIAVCFIMSILLVMPIRMFSFKFKTISWKGNEIRYLFILIALIVFAVLIVLNILDLLLT